MDISKASNFERFIFDVVGRDASTLRRLFDDDLQSRGAFTLDTSAMQRVRDEGEGGFGFVSGRSTHADRLRITRATWEQHALMIDPHTADGLKVALEQRRADETMLVLETALAAKFGETIHEALGRDPLRPAGFEGIEQLPKRFSVLPASTDAVKAFIVAST
jgi:threonine synthase